MSIYGTNYTHYYLIIQDGPNNVIQSSIAIPAKLRHQEVYRNLMLFLIGLKIINESHTYV